jgi:hypothetical protein
MEDIELPEQAVIGTQGLIVRTMEGEADMPPHTAPRRQLVIVLEGTMVVEYGDGTRTFGPGDLMLADDTTGEGHTSRFLGHVRVGAVAFAPDVDIGGWRQGTPSA